MQGRAWPTWGHPTGDSWGGTASNGQGEAPPATGRRRPRPRGTPADRPRKPGSELQPVTSRVALPLDPSPTFSCPCPRDHSCSGNCVLSLPEGSIQWQPMQGTVKRGTWVQGPSSCDSCPGAPPPRPFWVPRRALHPGFRPAGSGRGRHPWVVLPSAFLRRVGSQATGFQGDGQCLETSPGAGSGIRVPSRPRRTPLPREP